MILSASRRTDIPCYYSEWFMNRIRAGYVLTRNPMNHKQLSRLSLSPDIVDCIVFWTKDVANIIPHLDELDSRGYKYYFQFTLTPYSQDLEPNLRPKFEIEDTFIELSKRIGKDKVVWRYDPIILNDNLNIEYHKCHFYRLCEKLSPYTDTVTISFVDMYAKIKTPLIRSLTDEEKSEISEFIGKTAKEFGLRAVACCENDDLSLYGIDRASCIDKNRIEKICDCRLDVKEDKNQRNGCGCVESVDIGAYNTCLNGCVYCYANDKFSSVKRRHDTHDPQSELLVGTVADGEEVTNRKYNSSINNQIKL
ncbi:MAG: DUF1848 domain-containing protein [Clostridiales bacterium]|nr:MAG: DUF1848 domain-containing protein [Clostridiales bacterium]